MKNFGPVKDAQIHLRELNLFIGGQSIGKSTLAKLITIFTDYISLVLLINTNHVGWLKQLKSYDIDVYKDDDYQIIFELEEQNVKLSIKISKKDFIYSMIKDGKKVINGEVSSVLIQLKPLYHIDKIGKVLESKKEGDKEADHRLAQFLKNSLYIPAERNIFTVVSKMLPILTLAGAPVPQNMLQFMAELQNAKNQYSHLDLPLFGITYFNEGVEDYFVIDENKKLPLVAASSGIQSALPLLLVLHFAIKDREYSSFVIEEPECNLFPEKQVELLRHIIKMVRNENRVLTITTHSPYILSAVNNYLYAGSLDIKYGKQIENELSKVLPRDLHLAPDDVSVYSLGEDINDGIYCRSIIDEEIGMIDYNMLDKITASMSDEFDKLQNCQIKMLEE